MNTLINILKLNRRLLFYILFILIFNLFLTFVPLFNVFGFEFSFANSVLFIFVSGIYLIGTLSKENLIIDIRSLIKKIRLPFFLFLIIPPFISISHSLFTNLCSLKDGILFYLIIAAPSLVVGAALGIFVKLYFKRFKVFFFIIVVLSIILIPIIEFYFNPQVYFFNPVFGYFPGTIYDEGIKISTKLILYRGINLFFFSILAFICFQSLIHKFKLHKSILFILIICISGLFVFLSPNFGLSTTNDSLQKYLNKKIETEHFIIYTDKEVTEETEKNLALSHEYYFKQLSEFFKLKPTKKIVSYIFLNSAQKGAIFGSANADIAKTWLGQIYISLDSYDQTLKHELAHIFSASFGWGLFKVAYNFNPALIEGIAVAADPVFDENTIDYMAALAFQNGYKLNLANLFSGFNFFGKVSSLSYIYSGSFSRFLIKNYGIEKFKRYYCYSDFRSVYNLEMKDVLKSYYEYLSTFDLYGKEDQANYYFGRQTIFQKICPRYVADQLEDGWTYFNKKNYNESIKIFKDVLTKSPVYSAVIGLSSSLKEQQKLIEATNILKSYSNYFFKTSYYYNLQFRLADLYAASGQISLADSLYKTIINEYPSRTLFFLSSFRSELCKDKKLIIDYLAGTDSIKFNILKELNSRELNYTSLPFYFNLAELTNINYIKFISGFENFQVVDFKSSFAIFSFSKFMMKNFDFGNARKMAALSIRFKGDKNFFEIARNNFVKSNWFYYNAERILSNIKISNVPM